MKDYSMSEEERKDFVLGYEPTDNGQIIIKWAEGKPWPVPYTKKHENVLLKKMKEQVENADEFCEKKTAERTGARLWSSCLIMWTLIVLILALDGNFSPEIFSISSVLGVSSVPFIVKSIKISSVLKDLKKNKRFLEIEEKVNDNVRKDQNVLANVSKKTKRIVEEFPEDRPVFDINSFNYVPFKDLEQIVENVDRNERFGFDYDSGEVISTSVKKRTRKM